MTRISGNGLLTREELAEAWPVHVKFSRLKTEGGGSEQPRMNMHDVGRETIERRRTMSWFRRAALSGNKERLFY
jgi:hypothetical protein